MQNVTKDIPLANPRRERYCQERVAGKTQRQAMLAAWPDRARWEAGDRGQQGVQARGRG